MDDKVLGLKVAMDQVAVGSSQIIAEPGELPMVAEICSGESEVLLHQVINEVVLLPCVGLRSEGRREFQVSWQADVEKTIQLLECTTIVRLPLFPWLIGKRKEILFSKILNQRDITPRIVIENLRDIETVLPQEMRYRKEKAIVFTLERIVNSDERGMALCLESDDGSSRSSPLDGLKDNRMVRLELEVGTNGGEQGVGSHEGRKFSAVLLTPVEVWVGSNVEREERPTVWEHGVQRSELSRVPVTGVEE